MPPAARGYREGLSRRGPRLWGAAVVALAWLAAAGGGTASGAGPAPGHGAGPLPAAAAGGRGSGGAGATVTSSTVPGGQVAYDPNAFARFAVGPQPANWDIHAAAAAPWRRTLGQVLAQVWPSAFWLLPNGTFQLNTSLLTSAEEVRSRPQVVVYHLNPRAVWSDGTPVTYQDFVYNWEAQSGRGRFRDKGGAAFKPLDAAGYDRIASVSGTPADPYTVTVTFSSPYPGWQSLFSYLMPAHVARAVGFDHGFTDPVADLVSGGPFLVAELQPGYSLELVRNASYWGPPANLATVTYYFMPSAAETEDALAAGELDVATLLAQPGPYQALQAAGGLALQVVAASYYEDLDFNERSQPFSRAVVRRAVMAALDRSAMAGALYAPYRLPGAPVEDRAYLPGQPGYAADGTGYDKAEPARALALLEGAGYISSGHTLHTPGGLPVVLRLSVDPGDPVAEQLAQQVVSSCAAIGIAVKVASAPPSAGPLAGGAGGRPAPGWQMAIEERQVPVLASALASRYETGGPSNLDGYSSPAMDALLRQAATASGPRRLAIYGQVDALAWQDAADMPLVAVPVLVAANPGLLNLQVGPYFSQVAWDEQYWGFKAS